MPLDLVATCALGLEELLATELGGLGVGELRQERGAVAFQGSWEDVWRTNWRLRTANRVLVELGSWPGATGEELAAGAEALVADRESEWEGLAIADLFDPDLTFVIRATSSLSQLRDVRWVALKVKDGLVDGQRRRWGRRASVQRRDSDLSLRVWLHRDRAALLLDTSGEPLDRRGYRLETAVAPVRENLAAACVLASGWDGRGPVVDPMCGAGTLLADAALIARGIAPGAMRRGWAFERLPGFDAAKFAAIRREPIPAPGPDVALWGVDRSGAALRAARNNLERADLTGRTTLVLGDAFEFEPPAVGDGGGLLVVNPPYGERLAEEPKQWRRLGDLLKHHYTGWRAAVLAGDAGRGKWIGLKPSCRMPVRNGPIDARILVFDLY
jgi:23S rRNA G2445 N2-methylase RlmL